MKKEPIKKTEATGKQLGEAVFWTITMILCAATCVMCFQYEERVLAAFLLVISIALSIACVLQWVLYVLMCKRDKIDNEEKKRRK